MNRVIAALALVVTGVVLVGCAGDREESGGTSSGIRGTVLAGPQCPVETEESPCPPRPLGGVTIEVFRDGFVVAEATTTDRGKFSVALAAGRYEVRVSAGQLRFISSRPIHVDVEEGEFVDVDVPVDTGIR
jgi:hypothetical protein